MSTEKNNDAVVSVITKRINGVQKYLNAEKVQIPVQGQLLAPSSLVKLYQANLDARAAVTAGHASYKGALKAREETEVGRLAADESLKTWVLARFGAGSTEASELGFAPRKKAEISAEKRAAAVVQSRATREARGTMGKKAKLSIKGVVPTPTAPAAPESTSTSTPGPTLVALPALLTTATSSASSPAPSAQVAAEPVATPPPTAVPAPASSVASVPSAATAQTQGHS